MGGATSGKFTVKSCGKAHAWCAECRPAQAAAQRKPKPPRKEYDRPCRNCGRCDACLGIEAPEGMKVCRTCRETKPLSAFARRHDTGGYRNQCMQCRNKGMAKAKCEGCGKSFVRPAPTRTHCAACRPVVTKACARCGTEFVGSMDQRRYCSPECRDAASTAAVTPNARRQAEAASTSGSVGTTTRLGSKCSATTATSVDRSTAAHVRTRRYEHGLQASSQALQAALR
jgi:hypothetical protein